MPSGADDEGPANGLTLDQAIEILLRENLDLRGKSLEIPQAQADILTASLLANPVFYADEQLVPYGRYTKSRPGGQTQADVNVSYPLDISHKRSARTLYATRAKCVLEAQYQDAVRNAIDQLYTFYVNVLAARQTVRYSTASVKGFVLLYEKTDELYKRGQKSRADLFRIGVQLDAARVGLIDAEEALLQAKRDLAVVLSIPAQEAAKIEVRGTIEDREPPPPALEDLIRIALELRPDVVSWRLGVKTAEAGVRLQIANRTPDWYLLYQPYTFQDNSPSGLKSPTSWALGITAPLPVYNRNQGGIARAKLNVTQSKIEVMEAERQAMTDVEKALNEYLVTARIVKKIKTELEPTAKQVLQDIYRQYTGGAIDQLEFLAARRDYSDTVKQYIDTAVRHRRAMLGLNTVVGLRVFP
jgi:cobalt-zinc-cadmium efflux system outer membrane protein